MSKKPNPEEPPVPNKERKVEAVVVCDNYDDFLTETIPWTLRAVDNLVVVTSDRDKNTQRLCAKYDVQCVVGWNHTRGGQFDKARAINHGLAHLGCKNWLLHLDADIVLPDVFADWFTKDLTLTEDAIYGVDRYNVDSFADWEKLKLDSWLSMRRAWKYLITPPPIGRPASRVAHGDYEGWVPIGYFQLWHSSAQKRYPHKPGADGEHTDLLHAVQWPREKRVLIPEWYSIHLTTDQMTGQNWHGRKSPRFEKPKK